MENKKPNKKLIISVITLLALCALILISVICIKQFNTKQETTTGNYTNDTSKTNIKKDDNNENKTADNDTTKYNTENNKNMKVSGDNSSDEIENKSNGSVNNNNLNEINQDKNNLSDIESVKNNLSQNNNSQYTQSSNNTTNQALSSNNIENGGNNVSNSVSSNVNQSSSNNNITRYTQDEDGDYTTKVEIETNTGNSGMTEDENYQPSTAEDSIEDISSKSHIKEYDNWNLSVKDNDYSNLPIKINLLNAPYNNSEYCEEMLKQNYVVKLVEKPENSECNGFPESITINNDGNLNVDTHIYTKTGNLDFSNSYFSKLGDYVFGIYPENSNEELYQVIVTLRGITTEEGYITGKTYSLIQIKSILKNGEKVDTININIKNPNTSITIEKIKEKNSFWEKVYVDLYIDSYENEKYTVLDGNALDESINSQTESSSVKIGNHYVVRDENGIIPQTYKIADDGTVIIGRKYISPIASICKIASITMPENLGISKQDEYEIPVGTKYKAVLSSGKQYKEKYEIDTEGEIRITKPNPDDNKVIIRNLTGSNPKTGIFYTVVPFVIILVIATVGVIVIKKTSYKNDDDDEDNNE
ncbi:MAG: hypothetical protein IJH12_05520 [Clostridia bacterium]|nr:hypothetical protein [Clostridia bacterium]